MTPNLCARCRLPFCDQLSITVQAGFAHLECLTDKEKADREERARQLLAKRLTARKEKKKKPKGDLADVFQGLIGKGKIR